MAMLVTGREAEKKLYGIATQMADLALAMRLSLPDESVLLSEETVRVIRIAEILRTLEVDGGG